MKRTLISLLLLLPLVIMAQTSGTIRGKVIDKANNEPLGFVTVALVPFGQTAPVAGCNTNDDGTFVINGVKEGNYDLKFSFVGYLSDSRKVSITAAENKRREEK